jgi:hypothetical protein
MKAIFLRLNEILNSTVNNAADRGDVLTTAVALANSRLVPIPSAPVASPANYYNLQVLETVTNRIAELNEKLLFDIRSALNECRQFWMLRYDAAHPSVLPCVSTIGFVDTIVGAGIHLDRDLVCFANEHKEAILRIASELCLALGEK